MMILLAACSKEQKAASFNAQPSVYLIYSTNTSAAGTDSVSYSFVEKSNTMQTDTLWLPVRIAGSTTGYDRSISMVALSDSSTALPGVHYRLLDYHMPKDAFATRLGVVLLRDSSLRNKEVVLTLRLQPSADFPIMMKEGLMADGGYYSINKIRIIFSDRLIKPSNWDTYLVIFFGKYSDVKHRFIAATLGISSFPNTLGYPVLQYYQTKVRNALIAYNTANGPLFDENGQPLVFP